MQEITSVTSSDPQVSSNYQSSCIQQQPSWGAKQLPVSSPISNDRQLPTLHSTSSYHPTSTYASGTSTTLQISQQQPAFSPYSVQQRQISCKNLQPHTPTIRHASQVSQQPIQGQIHQHGSMQHPYSYPSTTYSTTTTIQKATLPTCKIPHNTSRAYSSVLSSQKVMYPQRSVSSSGCSSAFSPLPQPPTRQQQLITHHSTYNYQQQQFLLQQQQQQQRQKQFYGEQQQNQINASQDHQMYSNWR